MVVTLGPSGCEEDIAAAAKTQIVTYVNEDDRALLEDDRTLLEEVV